MRLILLWTTFLYLGTILDCCEAIRISISAGSPYRVRLNRQRRLVGANAKAFSYSYLPPVSYLPATSAPATQYYQQSVRLQQPVTSVLPVNFAPKPVTYHQPITIYPAQSPRPTYQQYSYVQQQPSTYGVQRVQYSYNEPLNRPMSGSKPKSRYRMRGNRYGRKRRRYQAKPRYDYQDDPYGGGYDRQDDGYGGRGYGDDDEGYGGGGYGDRDEGYGGGGYDDRDEGYGGGGYGDRDEGYGGGGYDDRDEGYGGGGYGDRDEGYGGGGYGDRDKGYGGGGYDDRDEGYGGGYDRDVGGYSNDYGQQQQGGYGRNKYKKKPKIVYVPVYKPRKKKKKMKIISIMPGFFIAGGTQLYGKYKSLKYCEKACAATPSCFAGDYNPWLMKCYLHTNYTACETLRAHKKLVHFSKVPCQVPEAPLGLITLGAQLFRAIEQKGIKCLSDCLKRCATAGKGIPTSVADIGNQLCFGVDYDFGSHKCYFHVDNTNNRICPADGSQPKTPRDLVANPAVVNIILCE
ncbi:hypothetical protein LSH36_138g02076 [Paralvinella palmiformis]|uniref:Uncharacterized protein n=1 Tax=Paralvinella palmiformis TaxID=53620 RepID=A0AAD9JX96_9ANNE|nr:hypothetical protein LSH36_138g02076 [Paralvinella palmiformis]